VWVRLHRAREQFLTRLRKLRPALAERHLKPPPARPALPAGGRVR
jgi:hypothetical protein